MRTKMMTLFALCALYAMPMEAKKVKGNGDIITKKISVGDYSAITINTTTSNGNSLTDWFILFSGGGSASCDFYYKQDRSATLIVTIDENLYPYLHVQVKDQELRISTQKGVQIAPTTFRFEGTSQKLEKARVIGGSDFILSGDLTGDHLSMQAAGGSDIKMEPAVRMTNKVNLEASGGSDLYCTNLRCATVKASATGGSDLKLGGKAEDGTFDASGGSDIKAYDLILSRLDCSASGGSDIYTHVTDFLKASASGGSDIHYNGSPKEKDISASGGSDIH